MSVLVEMKVAGWSWALLPKAPHSFWSYQQKSLLFQQRFPWQCSQSRKEENKKVSDILNASYIGKKMFSSETSTRSLSITGVTAAECRTRVPHRGKGHYQMITRPEILSHRGELRVWSKHRIAAAAAELTRGRWTGAGAAAGTVLPAHTPWEGPELAATRPLFHYQHFI